MGRVRARGSVLGRIRRIIITDARFSKGEMNGDRVVVLSERSWERVVMLTWERIWSGIMVDMVG